MLKNCKTFIALMMLLTIGFNVQAEEKERTKVDSANRVMMYIPDRIADLFDSIRVGIAVGPAIGAEIAITEYAALGAYTHNEAGVAWMGRGNQNLHAGKFTAVVYGDVQRYSDIEADHHFHKDQWDVRAQLALVLVHGYVGINLEELGDFFAGLVLCDPSKDSNYYETYTEEIEGETVEKRRSLWGRDQVARDYDTVIGTSPMHRLGRGLSNVAFGAWEIPQNLMDVTKDQGHGAGASYGLVRGLSRFVIREGVGVWEIVTFPLGGRPTIRPEYPWMPHEENNWDFAY